MVIFRIECSSEAVSPGLLIVEFVSGSVTFNSYDLKMDSTEKRRWIEHTNFFTREDGSRLIHPREIDDWQDDIRTWSPVSYQDIINYFVFTLGVDGEEMKNFKSMESYNFFHSGKVGAVFNNTSSSPGFCVYKAEVTASQILTTKHSAWVATTNTGEVELAGCTCTAGKGRTCSHAGAILWKLEYATTSGRSGMSCTDLSQKWNSGTTKNIEPKRVANIGFGKHRRSTPFGKDKLAQENCATIVPAQQQFLTHADLQTHASQSPLTALFHIQNSVLSSCVACNVTNDCPSPTPATPHGSHTSQLTCLPCKDFFDRHIDIDRTALEAHTQEQNTSKQWHDARKIRITASTAKKIPVRQATDPTNFLREHLYPTFRGNFATKHGNDSEPKALLALRDLGLPTKPAGTVLSLSEPWLSASPDGIVVDADGETIVEVKCPILTRPLRDVLQEGKCVSDVQLVDGKPVLSQKGRRGHYLQVQLAMFCTCAKQCKFFVWTEGGHLLLDVHYNCQFVEGIIVRLKKFYFEHMLPRIVDDFVAGRLVLCREYQSQCMI